MKSDDFAQHLHDWPAKPIPAFSFPNSNHRAQSAKKQRQHRLPVRRHETLALSVYIRVIRGSKLSAPNPVNQF